MSCFFLELSEGFEAAQGEGIEFARRLGHRYQGDNKAKGALEGLQSEWGEISDLVSFEMDSHFLLLFIVGITCFIFGSGLLKKKIHHCFSLELTLFRMVIIILKFKIVNCYTVSAVVLTCVSIKCCCTAYCGLFSCIYLLNNFVIFVQMSSLPPPPHPSQIDVFYVVVVYKYLLI